MNRKKSYLIKQNTSKRKSKLVLVWKKLQKNLIWLNKTRVTENIIWWKWKWVSKYQMIQIEHELEKV
jgi:hypothetical protein